MYANLLVSTYLSTTISQVHLKFGRGYEWSFGIDYDEKSLQLPSYGVDI